MRIHYLQHAPFEGLGFIEGWALEKGHTISSTRLYEGEILPRSDAFDFLIVMGGPMGACDDKEYPWLPRERSFITQAIRENRTVLGVCLGAQLLAAVLGAKVFPNRHKEIGWFPITLTDAARESPVFDRLPRQLTVFHWHGDTFDLPPGAIRMAESEACVNQAFVLGPKVLGLQFHLELSRSGVEELIHNCSGDLTEGSFIQSPAEMLSPAKRFDAAKAALYQVLAGICGVG